MILHQYIHFDTACSKRFISIIFQVWDLKKPFPTLLTWLSIVILFQYIYWYCYYLIWYILILLLAGDLSVLFFKCGFFPLCWWLNIVIIVGILFIFMILVGLQIRFQKFRIQRIQTFTSFHDFNWLKNGDETDWYYQIKNMHARLYFVCILKL